ncbi:MAG: sensor histidine kinase [Bryobacteraceae bacterium]
MGNSTALKSNRNSQRGILRAAPFALLKAQEDECRRVSRELHDQLGQQLAILEVEMEMQMRVPRRDPQLAAWLAEMQRRVAALSQDVRRICRQLHPSILEDLGLVAALSCYCEDFERRSGVKTRFKYSGIPDFLPASISGCIYRVVQESLRNVEKHSGAKCAVVGLRGLPENIQVAVEDQGCGFDPAVGRRAGGLGLISIGERVRLLEGEHAIDSAPGKGTRIRLSIPLAVHSAKGAARTPIEEGTISRRTPFCAASRGGRLPRRRPDEFVAKPIGGGAV